MSGSVMTVSVSVGQTFQREQLVKRRRRPRIKPPADISNLTACQRNCICKGNQLEVL